MDTDQKVIFLDVDGVLNRGQFSAQGLETDKCDLLGELVRETGAKVVVSSTWRFYPNSLKRLMMMFAERGIVCIGVTPDLTAKGKGGLLVAASRNVEIREWLMKHPEVKHYVILDDDAGADDGTGRFVKTVCKVGLTARHCSEALEVLNCQKP